MQRLKKLNFGALSKVKVRLMHNLSAEYELVGLECGTAGLEIITVSSNRVFLTN